jgi:transposase
MNALQGIALAHGMRRGASLWSRSGQALLTSLPLPPHAGDRRTALQALRNHLTTQIADLDQRVDALARERPQARRLMTHPGVGSVTALATEVFLGDPARFADAKAVASYIGMIPSEYSSGPRQRLGKITKQGNSLLRFLWCEAAIHAVQRDAALRRFYRRKLQQKGLGKARVAAARKLGIRLWILLRDQIEYDEFCRRGRSQTATR